MGLRRCQQAQTNRWLQESIDLFDCTTSRLFDTGNTPGVSDSGLQFSHQSCQDNAFTFTKCAAAEMSRRSEWFKPHEGWNKT